MDILFPYDENKLKPYVKMAIERIKITVNKKAAVLKHQKREVSGLLQENREEKARIRVENIIREDFMIESYELIELLCELVHERVKYISSQKECPPDIKEAVCSLIWATSRVDIEELNEVKKQLTKKYGRDFASKAENNEGDIVNPRLISKLRVEPPSALLVNRYLEEIAKEYNVAWTPTDLGLSIEGGLDAAVPTPQGFSIPMAPGSELRSAYQRHIETTTTTTPAVSESNNNNDNSHHPTSDIHHPTTSSTSGGAASSSTGDGGGGGGGGEVSLDDLMARFNSLNRK